MVIPALASHEPLSRFGELAGFSARLCLSKDKRDYSHFAESGEGAGPAIGRCRKAASHGL